MLVSNSYYTYEVNKDERYVGGSANINSSSNLDTIFEVELININKSLEVDWLKAYLNNEDRANSNIKQAIDIYIDDEDLKNEDAYVGFGFITTKEA